jgi:NTE family protein
MKERKDLSDKKIALILGAGGARGLCHIGIIEKLLEADISIDYIAGSSIGAIIGGYYALTGDIDLTQKRIIELIEDKNLRKGWQGFVPRRNDNDDKPNAGKLIEELRHYITRQYQKFAVFTKSSLASQKDLMNPLRELFEDKSTLDLKINFCATAVDLISGKEIHACDGKLAEIIYASSAIPGIFPPLETSGMLLSDGSISDLVPVDVVPQDENYVTIAVFCGIDPRAEKDYTRGLNILLRADELARRKLNQLILEKADLVIAPDVEDYHWSEFNRYEEIIEKGRKASIAETENIVRLIAPAAKKPVWWKRMFGWMKSSS